LLKKDGDQLRRLCENSSFAQNKGGKEYTTYVKRRKADCVGHFLRKNGFLKRVIEEKIEGTGRYRNMKDKTLDYPIRGMALNEAMDLSQNRLRNQLIHFLVFA